MELLLILSAMLSAVTGAFSGVRGPEAGVHQAEAAVGAQVIVSVATEQAGETVRARPDDAPPTTEVPALPTFKLAPAVPLYADRPIE